MEVKSPRRRSLEGDSLLGRQEDRRRHPALVVTINPIAEPRMGDEIETRRVQDRREKEYGGFGDIFRLFVADDQLLAYFSTNGGLRNLIPGSRKTLHSSIGPGFEKGFRRAGAASI